MKVEDIDSRISVESWLSGRPDGLRQQEAAILALRTTSRVVPVRDRVFPREWEEELDIQVLRAVMTAGVGIVLPSAEVKVATYYAAKAAASGYDVPVAYAAANTASAPFDTGAAGLAVDHSRRALESATDAGLTSYLWQQVRDDARMLEAGGDPLSAPLWSIPPPLWFREFDVDMCGPWSAEGPADWDFWLRWWDGVLSGQQLDWALQEAVALIPSEVWEAGPSAVAAAIREIEKGFQAKHPPLSIDGALSRMAPAQPEALDAFSTAVWSHRQDLPPTLDAVLGFCQLEITRLQGKNYRDDEEREECQRQIRVLMTLHQAVSQLAGSLNLDHPMTNAEAERPEKLTRLFRKSLTEWPRENVKDLVDSAYRVALVGVTAMALPMLGVPASIATGAGVVLFGGKKVADAVKAAKDISGL